MEEEIGKTAGAIWQALSTQGELSLTQPKNQVKAKARFFDWAIGWLAREDQIVITPEKRSFRIRLREQHAKATGCGSPNLRKSQAYKTRRDPHCTAACHQCHRVLLPSAQRRSKLTIVNLRELGWLFLKFVPVLPLALRYKA